MVNERMSNNITTYRRMAYISYKEYCKYINKDNNLMNDSSSLEMDEDILEIQYALLIKQYESAVSVIVFSAFSIEALCNDYISRRLGSSYNDYLDKLDVKSKLLVSVKLATGRDFPKGGQAYNVLNNLISVRNKLAHSKSIKMDSDNIKESFKKVANNYQMHIDKKVIDDSIKAFDLIIKELDKLDTELYSGYKESIEASISTYYEDI